jgi:hypothetical protein
MGAPGETASEVALVELTTAVCAVPTGALPPPLFVAVSRTTIVCPTSAAVGV